MPAGNGRDSFTGGGFGNFGEVEIKRLIDCDIFLMADLRRTAAVNYIGEGRRKLRKGVKFEVKCLRIRWQILGWMGRGFSVQAVGLGPKKSENYTHP